MSDQTNPSQPTALPATAKQKFHAAFGAVRAAAQGREVEHYFGQGGGRAESQKLSAAAIQAVRAVRTHSSWLHDSNLDWDIAYRATKSYAVTRNKHPDLASRFDIYKREMSGEYIYD